MRNPILLLIVGLIMIPLVARAAHVPEHIAGPVVQCTQGLSWDANTEPDMASYNLFVGRVSGVYGSSFSVPHTPSVRIVVPCSSAGVIEDGPYVFTVMAIDKSGNESVMAAEYPFFVDRPPLAPGGLGAN